jgi:CRISPR-associated protein Cas1
VGAETRLRVPLHHLQAVVCFGHVGLSAPLMHRLADDGIALVLLDAAGRFKARLEGATSRNVLLRQAQHRVAGDPAFALSLARSLVAGKLKNQRHVLMRGASSDGSAVPGFAHWASPSCPKRSPWNAPVRTARTDL